MFCKLLWTKAFDKHLKHQHYLTCTATFINIVRWWESHGEYNHGRHLRWRDSTHTSVQKTPAMEVFHTHLRTEDTCDGGIPHTPRYRRHLRWRYSTHTSVQKTPGMEVFHTHLRTEEAAIAPLRANSKSGSLSPHPHPHLIRNSLASTAHGLPKETINADFSGLHVNFHRTTTCCGRHLCCCSFAHAGI